MDNKGKNEKYAVLGLSKDDEVQILCISRKEKIVTGLERMFNEYFGDKNVSKIVITPKSKMSINDGIFTQI